LFVYLRYSYLLCLYLFTINLPFLVNKSFINNILRRDSELETAVRRQNEKCNTRDDKTFYSSAKWRQNDITAAVMRRHNRSLWATETNRPVKTCTVVNLDWSAAKAIDRGSKISGGTTVGGDDSLDHR